MKPTLFILLSALVACGGSSSKERPTEATFKVEVNPTDAKGASGIDSAGTAVRRRTSASASLREPERPATPTRTSCAPSVRTASRAPSQGSPSLLKNSRSRWWTWTPSTTKKSARTPVTGTTPAPLVSPRSPSSRGCSPQASGAMACCIRASRGTTSSAAAWVLSNLTGHPTPAA